MIGKEQGNEIEGRRPRRRWARVGMAVATVGALAMVTAACHGPLQAGTRTVAMDCVRSDKAGTQLLTYSSDFQVGITAPTWADSGDEVAVQDATISGAVTDADWIAITYETRNASPASLAFFRSPEDDQFDNVVRVKVTGAPGSDMEIAVNELFIVHPKGSSFEYDICKPKPGADTRLSATEIREALRR